MSRRKDDTTTEHPLGSCILVVFAMTAGVHPGGHLFWTSINQSGKETHFSPPLRRNSLCVQLSYYFMWGNLCYLAPVTWFHSVPFSMCWLTDVPAARRQRWCASVRVNAITGQIGMKSELNSSICLCRRVRNTLMALRTGDSSNLSECLVCSPWGRRPSRPEALSSTVAVVATPSQAE